MRAVEVGDFVQSKFRHTDDGELATEAGDVGNVLAIDDSNGCLTATVLWERTGRVYDVEADEVDVLCEVDFATRPETTPMRTRRGYLRRGVS